MLGEAARVVVKKDATTIVDGKGKKADVEGRVKQIQAEIDESDSDWDKEKLQERLAKLSGGVAVVKVGAATEVELKEKKMRIEDALAATRAAVEEGIVAGGGVTLIRAQESVDKISGGTEGEIVGRNIVQKALEAPLRQIAVNAGYEGGVMVEKVKSEKGNVGLNAATGETTDLKRRIVESLFTGAGGIGDGRRILASLGARRIAGPERLHRRQRTGDQLPPFGGQNPVCR